MKTFGNPATQELVSIVETQPYGFHAPGYHVEQLCPPGRYHKNDDRAPWNAYHNPDPAYWRAEYPAAWGDVADDDPAAPWNQPEPNRDPNAYLDENGEPLHWPTPTLVPLVKIPRPDPVPGQIHEPVLVWFDDRVERQWQARAETEAEAAARRLAEVPQVVTRRQLFLVLAAQNPPITRSAIRAMLAGNEAALIEFDEALSFQRSHPLIAALAAQMGLSEAEVDGLFQQAALL